MVHHTPGGVCRGAAHRALLVVVAPGDDTLRRPSLPLPWRPAVAPRARPACATACRPAAPGRRAWRLGAGARRRALPDHPGAHRFPDRRLPAPTPWAGCWRCRWPTRSSEVDGRVAATVDRSGKWLAQTPQMFRIGALQRMRWRTHAAGDAVTDEASAMEAPATGRCWCRQRAELQGHLPGGLRPGRGRAAGARRMNAPTSVCIGEGWDVHALVPGRRWSSAACTSRTRTGCWAIRTPTCCCTPSPTRCWARRAGRHRHAFSGHRRALSRAPIRPCCWPRRRAACASRLAHRQRGQHRHRAGATPGAAHRAAMRASVPGCWPGAGSGQREGQDGREAGPGGAGR
jgi:hypothetical protein